MDHEAYEAHMIETVNRHGEEATGEPIKAKRSNTRIVARGLKCTVLALFTVASFALSVIGFIGVASEHGYMAVVLFLASVITLINSYVLMYVMGKQR